MAPIKFDNTIKDKLEKRALQPSNDAWDKLSNRLEDHDKKNSRGLFLYIGLAASIVGVLFVTAMFFKSSEHKTVVPNVVETEIEQSQHNTKETIKIPESSEAVVSTSNQENSQIKQEQVMTPFQSALPLENKQKTAANSKEKNEQLVNNNDLFKDFKNQEVVAVSNKKNNREVVVLNELNFEDTKVIEVVNQIKKLELEGETITDTEIDNLLKKAQKEILRDHMYNEATRTVDAEALLQDVEADLETSFRTKVFESLKSSYKTVKTAVAERNN
ncbi:hypothetical protein A9Q86_10880 [Flavobacteriales bacterium 33_180_T64]|nr:hypothetical protein A9Q86_10880 [Flavobacteriales bacterium 33_180_T64]